MKKKTWTSHGMRYSAEYRIWCGMKQRCQNPKNPDYASYGGRGIRVCDDWLDFLKFYRDVGPRPEGKFSIDRINNDGNYEPSNCRWADDFQQNQNRRCCTNSSKTKKNPNPTGRKLKPRILVVNGESKRASEWARVQGIRRGVIQNRLDAGWSDDMAVLCQVKLYKPREVKLENHA